MSGPASSTRSGTGSVVTTPAAQPVASVVVPAHDEARVIARCLEALLCDAEPGEFEIVVVANGCSDETAASARSAAAWLGHAVRVVELVEASKAAALRAADAVASTFPRVYVDADVICSTATLRLLAAALEQPGVDLAVPQRHIDLSGATRGARLYYTTWSSLPRVRLMLAGRGCYALSRTGHQQLGQFPARVADDRFVTTRVPRAAARVVEGPVRIFPPGDLRSVLSVRTRVYAGNLQLGADEGTVHSSVRPLLRSMARPGAWSGAAVYAGVTALAKVRARVAVRRGDVPWGRDHARGSAQVRIGGRTGGSAEHVGTLRGQA